jgi:SAM-dependent methyltransferase
MVTRDDVINAYRFILGRMPESDAMVDAHAAAATLEDLRMVFLNSQEFQGLKVLRGESNEAAPPLDYSELPIEIDADPAMLAGLMDRISAEWEAFGKEDPHWSVLTHEDFRKDAIDGNRESFFASGAHIVNVARSFCTRNGLDIGAFGLCLELGCGVGRITTHLAKVFPRVIGVDISESHLSVCRQELELKGIENVSLRSVKSVAQLDALPEFDFFVSFIVLQHNPPPVIRIILEKILRKLRPGGVALFQVPVYKAKYAFRIADYLKQQPHMEMHALPQRHVLALIRQEGCQLVEFREDGFASGRSSFALSNTFFVLKPAANP